MFQNLLGVRSPMVLGWLRRKELWRWDRDSVALSVLIGLTIAMLPIPAQMLLATALAVSIQAYLPLAVALVWISNPLTILPLSWFCLKLGCYLLGINTALISIETAGDWLAIMQTYWQPLLLGSFVTGLTMGLLGYCLTRIAWFSLSGIGQQPLECAEVRAHRQD